MKHSVLKGRDLHSPTNEIVENKTVVVIPKLTAVYFAGMGDIYPKVERVNGLVETVRGITHDDILPNQVGVICSLGFLTNQDTSSWTVGTRLYANSSGQLITTVFGLPIATVLKQDASLGILYVDNTGVTKGDLESLGFPDSLSMELEWAIQFPDFFTEPVYDISNRLTQVNIYDSAAKGVHIFNKTLTYSGSLVVKVEVTRIFDGQKITKDIEYYPSGLVKNVNRTYTI